MFFFFFQTEMMKWGLLNDLTWNLLLNESIQRKEAEKVWVQHCENLPTRPDKTKTGLLKSKSGIKMSGKPKKCYKFGTWRKQRKLENLEKTKNLGILVINNDSNFCGKTKIFVLSSFLGTLVACVEIFAPLQKVALLCVLEKMVLKLIRILSSFFASLVQLKMTLYPLSF